MCLCFLLPNGVGCWFGLLVWVFRVFEKTLYSSLCITDLFGIFNCSCQRLVGGFNPTFGSQFGYFGD